MEPRFGVRNVKKVNEKLNSWSNFERINKLQRRTQLEECSNSMQRCVLVRCGVDVATLCNTVNVCRYCRLKSNYLQPANLKFKNFLKLHKMTTKPRPRDLLYP